MVSSLKSDLTYILWLRAHQIVVTHPLNGTLLCLGNDLLRKPFQLPLLNSFVLFTNYKNQRVNGIIDIPITA